MKKVAKKKANDESGILRKEYPHLYDAIKALNAAIEETESG